MRPPFHLFVVALLVAATASCLEIHRKPATQDAVVDAATPADVPGDGIDAGDGVSADTTITDAHDGAETLSTDVADATEPVDATDAAGDDAGDLDATAVPCGELPAGSPCDDGNPCTVDDTCLDGLCVGTAGPEEHAVCDGVDNNCNGITDEGCLYTLTGAIVGNGATVATDPAVGTLWQATGTTGFVGISEGGGYRLRGGWGQEEYP